MKKYIDFTPVEGVVVHIARRINELTKAEWGVYLINQNETTSTNVFVTSRGYSGDDEMCIRDRDNCEWESIISCEVFR